jgi:hypothetical protein
LAIQFNQLTRLGDTRPKERPAARERIDLTSEITRAMNGYKGLSGIRGANNFDLT